MADTLEPELSLERFGALVEAYGADFERFPQRERAAARALALRSPDAQRVLQAARAFDGLLAAVRGDLPNVELEARLDRIPEQFSQERRRDNVLPFRSRQQTFLAAAAAVLLGLFSGQLMPDDEAASSDVPDGTSVLQADIASLTFADDLFEDLTVEGSTE